MPGLTKTSRGSAAPKWLASAHGMTNARSSVLDVSTFTEETHYPDGYFPSGLAVNAADEAAVKPWTGADGEELGFVLFDAAVEVNGEDLNVAVLRHGLINTAYLPVTWIAPTTVATAAPGFTFIDGSDA